MANRTEYSGLTGGWVLGDVLGNQPVVLGLGTEQSQQLTSSVLASTVDGRRALRAMGALTASEPAAVESSSFTLPPVAEYAGQVATAVA